MYTRCKGCHTVHPVNASLLATAGGKFRCGKCKKTGNALEALFDEWPQAGDRPTAPGPIPDLGLTIDLAGAKASQSGEDESAENEPAGRKSLMRFAWVTMALVVIIAVTIKLADYFDQPLLEVPAIQSAANWLGFQAPRSAEVFRDLAQIHLVNRDLRSHPFEADMLQLTATIVNRASTPQPYPDLEIILLDASGQPVSRSLFRPADYLAEDASTTGGMTPQAYLPLVLDLPDPGQVAVGFELNFL
jgi:predicted Zn finger-like uncharacterized protein